jgi:hypothetical protein
MSEALHRAGHTSHPNKEDITAGSTCIITRRLVGTGEFIWPSQYQPFRERILKWVTRIDLSTPHGVPIYAADLVCNFRRLDGSGYGNTVLIDHSNDTRPCTVT